MKIVNIILLFLFALFTLLCFSGKIAFGHGIGDIIYIGLSGLSFLLLLFAFLNITYKKRDPRLYIVVAITTFIILLSFCLKATIFRGPEYSWHNHRIFY